MTVEQLLTKYKLELTPEQLERHRTDLVDAAAAHAKCAAGECDPKCPGFVRRPAFSAVNPEQVIMWDSECPRRRQRRFEARREALVKSSQRPELLADMRFNNFEVGEGTRDGFEAALRLTRGEIRNLVLAGPSGTGKTHLAAAVLNNALAAYRPAVFETVPELLDAIRLHERRDGIGDVMALLTKAEPLVLDDVGVERPTAFALEQLFKIINARVLRERQTLATSNFESPGELIEHLGGRIGAAIVSRLFQSGEWVALSGPDYRLGRSG